MSQGWEMPKRLLSFQAKVVDLCEGFLAEEKFTSLITQKAVKILSIRSLL